MESKQPSADQMAAWILLMDCVKRYPQLRICQIIVNATGYNDPYHVTDDNLARFLADYLDGESRRDAT